MSVNCEVKDNQLIVHLTGDLDHHHSQHIKDKIDRCFSSENAKNIVFDLSGIHFMDSSGIGLIMGRYRRVNYIGGQVLLSNVSPQLDKIFRLSGLYKIMNKFENVDEAIHAL